MRARFIVVSLGLLASSVAHAADPGEVRRACGLMPTSPLLSLATAQMRDEVARRFDRSVEVASAAGTVSSTSPRFVWATETKAACGIAIGFFGGGEVNEEWVNKCDCFHQRMMAYTNSIR